MHGPSFRKRARCCSALSPNYTGQKGTWLPAKIGKCCALDVRADNNWDTDVARVQGFRFPSLSNDTSISTKNGILIASLKPSLPFAEEVTDDLAKVAKLTPVAARNCARRCMMVSPCRLGISRGLTAGRDKEGRTGTAAAKRRTHGYSRSAR